MRSSIFRSNGSQAVLLPDAVAMPEHVDHVEVIAIGRSRIIAPADQCWDSWFDGPCVTTDFMTDRKQPVEQARESL